MNKQGAKTAPQTQELPPLSGSSFAQTTSLATRLAVAEGLDSRRRYVITQLGSLIGPAAFSAVSGSGRGRRIGSRRGNGIVGIRSAIPVKRPDFTDLVYAFTRQIGDQNFLFVSRLGDHLANRINK